MDAAHITLPLVGPRVAPHGTPAATEVTGTTDGADTTESSHPVGLASRARILALITPHQLEASAYVPSYGDLLLGTYCVQRQLGRGSFGTVVRARHMVTNTAVAIKVLHNLDGLHLGSRHEERAYRSLLRGCSPHISLFAKVLGGGIDRGFSCTVFELCDMTLYDVIRGGANLLPLPSVQICEIANQIIRGVAYLHSLGLIHTDIKPDNIALRRTDTVTVRQLDGEGVFHLRKILASTAICIIDLGGVVTFKQASQMKGLLCAPMYRAPEVLLGLPWSYGVDTYAVGCVIVELFLTEDLFHPEIASDREHLTMIERVLERFPPDFASAIEEQMPGTFHISHAASVIFPPAKEEFSATKHAPAMQRILEAEHISARIHDVELVDLLRNLCVVDPARRIALHIALRHIYFDKLRHYRHM
ncbi:Serine/threonine-protein kinase AFC2 [Trametes pubescens]|uniref:Serine/threonine-protein kinase AFC2 n=1 Tax=Trametes pubescens TaxID=154538 RepID=A0A1M2VPD9_TRAPU|nr:Serine/threonine-protein kinase AFC2 [Trametes pubescens]